MQENNHESNSHLQDYPEDKDNSTKQKEEEIKSMKPAQLPEQLISSSSLSSSKDIKDNRSQSLPNQDEFVPNVLKVHGYLEVLGIVTPTDDNETRATIALEHQKSNGHGAIQTDNGTMDKTTLKITDTQPVLTLDNFCGELKIDGEGLHSAVRKIQNLNATADVAPHDDSIHETQNPTSLEKPAVMKNPSKEKPQGVVKSSPSLTTHRSLKATLKTRPQPKQSSHQTASTPKQQNTLVKKASKHVSSNHDARKDTARDPTPAASHLILPSSQSLKNEKKKAVLSKKGDLRPLIEEKGDSQTLKNSALHDESPLKSEKLKGDSETQQDETKNIRGEMSEPSLEQEKNHLQKQTVVQSKDVTNSPNIHDEIIDGSGKALDIEPSTQASITEPEKKRVTDQPSGGDDDVDTAAHIVNAQSHSECRVDDPLAKEASEHNSSVINMPTQGQPTQPNSQESIHATQSTPAIASSAFPEESTMDNQGEALSDHSPPLKNDKVINDALKGGPKIHEKTQQKDKDPLTATSGSQKGIIKKSQETPLKEKKQHQITNSVTSKVKNATSPSQRKETGISNTAGVTSSISKFPVPLHVQKVNDVVGLPQNPKKIPTDVQAAIHSPREVYKTNEHPLKDNRLKEKETTLTAKKGKVPSTSKTKNSTTVSKALKDGVQRHNRQEKTTPSEISHDRKTISPSTEVKTTVKKPSVTHDAVLNKTQVIRSPGIESPDENAPEKQSPNPESNDSTVKGQPDTTNNISNSPSLKSLQTDKKLDQNMKETAVEDQTMKELSSTDTDRKETPISSDTVGRENRLTNNTDVVTSQNPVSKLSVFPTEAEIHNDVNNQHQVAVVSPTQKNVKSQDQIGEQVGTTNQPDNVALDTQKLTTNNEELLKRVDSQTTKEQQVGETVRPSDSSATEPLETSPTENKTNNLLKVSVEETKVDDTHGRSSSDVKNPATQSASEKRLPKSQVPSRSIASGGSIKKAARKDKYKASQPMSSVSTLRYNPLKSTSLKSITSQATVKKQALHNKDGKSSLDLKPNESAFNLDKRTANMKTTSPVSHRAVSKKNSGHVKKNALVNPISYQTRKGVNKSITQQKFKSPGNVTHENSASSSLALREKKIIG